MNAIMQLPFRKPVRRVSDDLAISYSMPANDDRLKRDGAAFGREDIMSVSFVGLTADEAERALASFPGARRCRLIDA